ncbi:TPA: hypothetical protein N5N93_001797 [Enterobacter kobei]|nr:hypothetical protein [Enterobacter kobei]HCM9653020.1 hypothetical protein [Enterobacter kobei]
MNPEFKLEEQLIDIRSDQIAYKLTISNPEPQPINLITVVPRLPIGASLLEVTDSSLAQINAQKAELISELTQLLRQYLWVTSSNFREQLIDNQKQALKQVFTVTGFFAFYFQIILNTSYFQSRLKRDFETFSYRINSYADAKSAYDRWMANSPEHEVVKSLFEEKMKQLERTELHMDENERPGLTSIPSQGFFTATYVIKFSRKAFEPRKFQVAFDATYKKVESSTQSNSIATNVQISPYPITLTIVAMLAAILGVMLRISVADQPAPLKEILALALSGKLLIGPILALIFFNVYEYTSIGKELGLSVSWRSALLIGALSGLAQDRILDALKSLIGA